jgi:hypothetical protein
MVWSAAVESVMVMERLSAIVGRFAMAVALAKITSV